MVNIKFPNFDHYTVVKKENARVEIFKNKGTNVFNLFSNDSEKKKDRKKEKEVKKGGREK